MWQGKQEHQSITGPVSWISSLQGPDLGVWTGFFFFFLIEKGKEQEGTFCMQMGRCQNSPLNVKLHIQLTKWCKVRCLPQGLHYKGAKEQGGLNGLCQQVPSLVAMGTPPGLTKGIS